MDSSDIISLLVGAVVGAATSWIFGEIYFRKAAKDMREESKRLRRSSDNIIAFLQNSRNPNAESLVEWDEEGHVKGVGVAVKVTPGRTVAEGKPMVVTGTQGAAEIERVEISSRRAAPGGSSSDQPR